MKNLVYIIIAISFSLSLKSQCPWNFDFTGADPFNFSQYYFNNIQTMYGFTEVNGCGIIVDSLDIIGAFIDSANTGYLKLVGYQYLDTVSNLPIGVMGNAPSSGFYGPNNGDTLIWKVWDDSENREYLVDIPFTTPGAMSGGVVYQNMGEHLIDTINADIYSEIHFAYEIIENSVSFENSSKSYSYVPVWHFGDGDSAEMENPVHIYNQNGLYSVTLTIANECNSLDTSVVIKIDAFPEALFDFTTEEREVTFNNLSQHATDYFWDFGDGTTSVDFNPVHIYNSDSIYYVSLNASNSFGDSTYIDTVQVISSGISEHVLGKNIFPNPTTGKFTISHKTGIEKIQIYNCLGTMIIQKDLSQPNSQPLPQPQSQSQSQPQPQSQSQSQSQPQSQSQSQSYHNLDISSYPAGIYFVKLTGESFSETLKLLKEKQ